MKNIIRLVGILIFLIAALQTEIGQSSGFGDIHDSVKKIVGSGGGGGLGNTDVVNGLKEALEIGTGYAVGTASKPDGYYSNPSIKIPLPGEVQKVEKLLRAIGYGRTVDEFELSMNRAAEKTTPQAKSIFVDAVKQMQFDDAQKILQGPDIAATEYFKEKTFGRLTEVFKPMVRDSMSSVGVTRQYEDLNSKLSSIPMGGKLGFDLDQYVTAKSIKGLFFLVAVEEKKSARTRLQGQRSCSRKYSEVAETAGNSNPESNGQWADMQDNTKGAYNGDNYDKQRLLQPGQTSC